VQHKPVEEHKPVEVKCKEKEKETTVVHHTTIVNADTGHIESLVDKLQSKVDQLESKLAKPLPVEKPVIIIQKAAEPEPIIPSYRNTNTERKNPMMRTSQLSLRESRPISEKGGKNKSMVSSMIG
jgi:hypothetical protein